MDLALWIAAVFLALVFGVGGAAKVVVPKDKIAAFKFAGWVKDWSPGAVRTIGGLEVLAAIGLILPPLVGIGTVFVPLAAVGIVLVMIGAIFVHARRREPVNIAGNLVYLAVAGFVAWGRFGPESFMG
ncbi:DoxX family protein [Nocardiopsis chromatogenes]|uniref:DoxX family protein n=1 Tax=Nocardiopsis chromatogenes TaxID=280239 RepID=UPI000345D9DF|nr:DoxX family protein [Nocardiopsis chromatogenes]